MCEGRFSSSVPRHYCSIGLRVKPLFHVESGSIRSLLWGIIGMVCPCTYPSGILPTTTGKCRYLGDRAVGGHVEGGVGDNRNMY